jgi:hypothetical protein
LLQVFDLSTTDDGMSHFIPVQSMITLVDGYSSLNEGGIFARTIALVGQMFTLPRRTYGTLAHVTLLLLKVLIQSRQPKSYSATILVIATETSAVCLALEVFVDDPFLTQSRYPTLNSHYF